MALYPCFPLSIRAVIQRFVPAFLKNKTFEGKNDLVVTDQHRILVAANAALVGAAQRVSHFDTVRWILLYRSIPHIDGEAFMASKIVLSWECVEEESSRPQGGGNLVVHEFSHVLDHLLGVSHGTQAMVAAFDAVEERVLSGNESLFRDEDVESPEEFFCAASELYFTYPRWLLEAYPGLYRDLKSLYGLDMALYWNS